jgi:hypothetical protein
MVKGILVAILVSIGIASYGQSPAQQPSQPPACTTKQEPGFMVSWTGQSSAKDHSELRSLTKGTHLACQAFAAEGSTPTCSVSMENGGRYTIASHEAIRIPHDDNVTLSCKGKNPTCCKLQMTPDPTPVKKSDTKPQPEPQLGIVK